MKKAAPFLAGCLILFHAFGGPSLGFAEGGSTLSFLEGGQSHVSINLRDSDLIDVLKFLAQKGKFNVVTSPQVQGKVSLLLEDVKISDVFDILLVTNKLAFYKRGAVVYVMTEEEYKARYGQSFGDAREAKIIKLKYASPDQVFKMLQPTKSEVGNLVVDEETGTIVLVDIPEKIELMLRIIKEVDLPLETRVFDLSYAKAEDVQVLLVSKLGSKGISSIHADKRSNQIVVSALPERMREIERIVEGLDRKTREVSIDTQIMKVVLSHDHAKGIDWRLMAQQGFLEPLDLNITLPTSSSAIATRFGSLSYSTFAAEGFEAVASYLETLGESKILANPRLTVIEGEEARINIGTREAYVTSTTTTGSSTTSVSENVTFVDVGIILSVTPIINDKGYVTMKIKPEVSNVVRTLTTAQGNKIPIVDKTEAETRVMVKDGSTIVIGGLRKDDKGKTVDQIPILGDIPVLGRVFKSRNEELEQTEIVVFLTPRIIEGDERLSENPDVAIKDLQAYPPQSPTQGYEAAGGAAGAKGSVS